MQQAIGLLCARISYLEALYNSQFLETADQHNNQRFTDPESHPEPSQPRQPPRVHNTTTNTDADTDDDDKSPPWPRLPIMVADLILSLVLTIIAALIVALLVEPYYSFRPVVFTAYLFLAVILLAVLHAYAFYCQHIARKKASWIRKMRARTSAANVPCEICGRVSSSSSRSAAATLAAVLPKRSKGKGRAWFKFGRGSKSNSCSHCADVGDGDVAVNGGQRACGRDVEEGRCASFVESESETSGLLVSTPLNEDEEREGHERAEQEEQEVMKRMRVGYGTLEGPIEAEGSTVWTAKPIRKKSVKRIVGEEWHEKGKKKGRGEVKNVDNGNDDIEA
jgi:hypothetical protein